MYLFGYLAHSFYRKAFLSVGCHEYDLSKTASGSMAFHALQNILLVPHCDTTDCSDYIGNSTTSIIKGRLIHR